MLREVLTERQRLDVHGCVIACYPDDLILAGAPGWRYPADKRLRQLVWPASSPPALLIPDQQALESAGLLAI